MWTQSLQSGLRRLPTAAALLRSKQPLSASSTRVPLQGSIRWTSSSAPSSSPHNYSSTSLAASCAHTSASAKTANSCLTGAVLRSQHTHSGDGSSASMWSSSQLDEEAGSMDGYATQRGLFVPILMPSQPVIGSLHRPGSGSPVLLDPSIARKLQLWDSASYSAALDEMLANAQVESEEEAEEREHGHQDVMVMELDLDGPATDETADLEHQMGNVLKKRRRKMNKHKHRKLLKKQRFLRRKLKK